MTTACRLPIAVSLFLSMAPSSQVLCCVWIACATRVRGLFESPPRAHEFTKFPTIESWTESRQVMEVRCCDSSAIYKNSIYIFSTIPELWYQHPRSSASLSVNALSGTWLQLSPGAFEHIYGGSLKHFLALARKSEPDDQRYTVRRFCSPPMTS